MSTLLVFTLLAVTMSSSDDLAPSEPIQSPHLEYRQQFDLDTGSAVPPVVSLSLLAEPQAAPENEDLASDVPGRFGSVGTRWFSVHGAFGAQFSDFDNRFAMGGLGASWFVLDHLSLNVELNGFSFTQRGPDAAGVSAAGFLRWHFLHDPVDRLWSIYFDAGAGVLFTTDDVPAAGSSVNLTPQAGFGFTWSVAEKARLFGGWRWLHISNANTSSANPGRDSYELYLGVMFPF